MWFSPQFLLTPFLLPPFSAGKEFYTWGLDTVSQSRVGTPHEFRHWSKIGNLKSLEQLHFGPQHVSILVRLDLSDDTEVWTWGGSNRGMLGISPETYTNTNPSNLTPRGGAKLEIKRQPVLVTSLSKEGVIQLAGSETHMVALTSEGRGFFVF